MNIKTYIKKQYIPNYLTILRIFFMVLVIIFILVQIGNPIYYLPLNGYISSYKVGFRVNDIVAGSFFIIASITDFLDGYLARKYNWISDFGKLWDPLADKLLVDGSLICLSYNDLIPVWITVILILRDFIVDAFRMNALRKKIVVSSKFLGKLKTVFEMIGLILIFFFFHFSYDDAYISNQIIDWYLIQNLFMIIATIFSLCSMIEYICLISKLTKNKQNTMKEVN